MNVRRVRIALVAITVCFLVVAVYRLSQPRKHASSQDQTNVVIAAHDLQMETRLNDADIQGTSRPDLPPAGCRLDKAQLIGRRVIVPIQKADVICLSALASDQDEPSFTAFAMRAVWVSINKVERGKSLQAGTRIDVLAQSPRSRNQTKIRPFRKNLLVLAVGQESPGSSHGEGSIVPVALLVSPDDAQKLATAGRHCRLLLSPPSP